MISQFLELEHILQRFPTDFRAYNLQTSLSDTYHICTENMNLPNPRIESRSPTLKADSLLAEPPGKPSFPEIPRKIFLLLIGNE